jgi:hypothetical protein
MRNHHLFQTKTGPISLNFDFIVAAQPLGTGARVTLFGGAQVEVKESFDEVGKLLGSIEDPPRKLRSAPVAEVASEDAALSQPDADKPFQPLDEIKQPEGEDASVDA